MTCIALIFDDYLIGYDGINIVLVYHGLVLRTSSFHSSIRGKLVFEADFLLLEKRRMEVV